MKIIPLRFASLLPLVLLVACGDTSRGTFVSTAERGQALEVGYDSCQGFCGEEAPAGCWCDDLCDSYGDCCEDKALECDNVEPSCEGFCGERSDAGCWCDELCAQYGDCCPDKQAVCDAPSTNDCTAEGNECTEPERCVGIPHDGSTDLGKCIDTTYHPDGEGASCTADTDCNADLVCVGGVAWGDGICSPEWMAGSWTDDALATIPDNDANGVERSVIVYGLATVPVDILVDLSIDHSRASDLRVTLTDPNGVESVVVEEGSQLGNGIHGQFVVGGNPRDDSVNGRWTLRVVDGRNRRVGQLQSWTLSLTSRWD